MADTSRRKANQFAPNDHQPWTLEEMQAVVDHDMPDATLATLLGRSEQAIQTKRNRIGQVGMEVAEHYFGGRCDRVADLSAAELCSGCNLALPKTGVCDDCA